MRNLKKILALVLALVMSLSLMATASAGSFQDVTDDNPYKTAIDVLDQLKVFQGFEDGTFKPTDTLNRAQAAVLVYRIATGDVEGKQVDNYTYMAQSKFVDLDGYNWAKGYINYCQNAGIVVGTDATHFNPGGQVTGYQLLVMLLRTLGYGKAGEFTDPKGWELQTATIAEREGITKNVTGGDFGAAAPRQMVAEILFRGLLTETVTYSALTSGGYTKTGVTLGKRELGLEEITGVITANEIADLYGSVTMKDGTTELTTDDKTYTVDISTTMDDLGESRHAYLQNGKTVLAMDGKEELNSTAETVDKANDLKALLKEANASLSSKSGSETERYVNFDFDGRWSSDYKIKYVLKFVVDDYDTAADAKAAADKAAAKINAASGCTKPTETGYAAAVEATDKDKNPVEYTVTRTIVRNETITGVDRTNLQGIFGKADKLVDDANGYLNGEIYVGTQTLKDISDDPDYSYEIFEEKFLRYKENSETVGSNENDNWLKVIDNDGDGIVEYVLKVVYTMTDVVRVRDEKITLGTQDDVMTGNDAYNNITADNEIVCADELAVDDIVYYALIDGDIQATKVEPVTVTIDKKNLNKKTVTTTGDATEYQNSGVSEMIEDAAYTSDVLGMFGKVSYDLYLGRGGHVIAYVETNLTNAFTLITNGWYMSQRGGAEYAVMTYNDESAALEDVTVTTGAKRFITSAGQNNHWGQLRTFDSATGALNAEGTAVWTTVAALQDETLLPVDNDSVSTRNKHVMIDVDKDDDDEFVIPRAALTTGDVYTSTASLAYDRKGANYELRATSDTVYYYVYPDRAADKDTGKDVVVKSYTGYANAPKPVEGKDTIEDVYAVGTAVTRAGYNDKLVVDYYAADVVVVEFSSPYVAAGEPVFVYDSYLYNKEVSQYNVDLINSKGEKEEEVAVSSASIGTPGDSGKKFMPGAYWRYPTSTEGLYLIERMTAEDAAKNFMIGQITTSRAVEKRDYADVACLYKDGTVAKYEQPKLGEESAYYQLNYAVDSKYSFHVASLNDNADYIDVLPEGVERVLASDPDAKYREFTAADHGVNYSYYYNDVLVYAPKGTIVYAVSFRNFGDKYDVSYVDYAQNVWGSMRPDAPVPMELKLDLGLKTGETGTVTYNKKNYTPGDDGVVTIPISKTEKNVILTVTLDGTAKLGAAFPVSDGWTVLKPITKISGENAWTVKLSYEPNIKSLKAVLPADGTHVALWTVEAIAEFAEEAAKVTFADLPLADQRALANAVEGILAGKTAQLPSETVDAVQAVKEKIADGVAVNEAQAAVADAVKEYEANPNDAAAKESMYDAALAYAEALEDGDPTEDAGFNTAVKAAEKDVKAFTDALEEAEKKDEMSREIVASVYETLPSENALALGAANDEETASAVEAVKEMKAACDAADDLIAESKKADATAETLAEALAAFEKANVVDKQAIITEDWTDWAEIEAAIKIAEKANAVDAKIEKIDLTTEAKKTMEISGTLPNITLTYTDKDTTTEAFESLTEGELVKLLDTTTSGAAKGENKIIADMVTVDETNKDTNSKVFNVTVAAKDTNGKEATATITVKVLTDAEKLARDKASLEKVIKESALSVEATSNTDNAVKAKAIEAIGELLEDEAVKYGSYAGGSVEVTVAKSVNDQKVAVVTVTVKNADADEAATLTIEGIQIGVTVKAAASDPGDGN